MPNALTSRASELPEAVRSAVESVLGRPVSPEEEVTISASTPKHEPPPESREEQAKRLAAFLDRRWEKVKDVPPEEIEEVIDEAVRHARQRRA